MLVPKKPKYRKHFRRGAKTIASRGTELGFGSYGLKSLAFGRLSERQLEAARRTMAHFTKRGGKIWMRVFPDKAVTKKPAGSGMGAGKGEVVGYVAVVTPGKIIFEIAGVSAEVARGALARAADKLSLKTRFVAKE